MSATYLKSRLGLSTLKPIFIHFDKIDSTNAYLLGDHHHSNGTVALADFQTDGKGRNTRVWESPQAEALLFSIFLEKNLHKYPFYAFTFLAAISVYEGLKTLFPDIALALKWPNDILIAEKKVCGILIETKTAGNQLSKIVMGIGINVNQEPEFFSQDLLKNGTSLFIETSEKQKREKVLFSVISKLDANLTRIINGSPDFILHRWKELCPFMGQKIHVVEGENHYHGIFQDITDQGGLLLRKGKTVKTFYAADVTISRERV